MENEQQLELLGLNDKEARVYLNALSMGSFTVADIAKKSAVKRPTCYLILEELVKKGLVCIIPNTKKLSYRAESPEVLIRQAERNANLTKQIVPKLLQLQRNDKDIPVVKYYFGQKGIQNIYEETLAKGLKDYWYIGSARELIEAAGADFVKNYIERRVKKGIRVRSIRMRKSEMDEPIYGSTKYLRDIRFSPASIYIPATIFIYGNKIAIMSTKKLSFGLVVESTEVAETMRGLFEALWQISSEK